MSLDKKIEAILFYKAEPVRVGELARILETGEEEVRRELGVLEESLSDRGILLMRKDDSVVLATAPEAGELIERITKEELSKDLGKAALETLSVVLYRGPVMKSEIDYIRGVNSSFILRSLLVRGLVERIPNPGDQRSFLYRPTFDLLAHLGVRSAEELPEYEKARQEVAQFEDAYKKEEADSVGE